MEIYEICRDVRHELKKADMYAYEAAKHKVEYPDLAQRYYRAATTHMETADELMLGAERMVDEAKRRNMPGVEHEHEKLAWEREMMMDDKECIMRKLDMYKG